MPRGAEAAAFEALNKQEETGSAADSLAGQFEDVMESGKAVALRDELYEVLLPVIQRVADKFKYTGEDPAAIEHMALDIIPHVAGVWKKQGQGSFEGYFSAAFNNYISNKFVRKGAALRSRTQTMTETEGRKNLGEKDYPDAGSMNMDEKMAGAVDEGLLRTNIREIVRKAGLNAEDILVIALKMGLGQQWVRDAMLAAPDKGGKFYKLFVNLVDPGTKKYKDSFKFDEEYKGGGLAQILGTSEWTAGEAWRKALKKLKTYFQKL